MSLTGEEIRTRLTRFAARWSQYDGGERKEAQTFLNQLFHCYGMDRQAIRVERGIGLTDFYNLLDDGAFDEVRALHRRLDERVSEAYGWPKPVAHDPLELRARLADLHGRIEGGETIYEPFAYLADRDPA